MGGGGYLNSRWEVAPQNRWEIGGWPQKTDGSCEVETFATYPYENIPWNYMVYHGISLYYMALQGKP